jgi:hypothetical protein
MVGAFGWMIYSLIAAGLSHREARDMPVSNANEILACHWQAQGLHVDRMSCKEHGVDVRLTREQQFAEISNRTKSWPSELH